MYLMNNRKRAIAIGMSALLAAGVVCGNSTIVEGKLVTTQESLADVTAGTAADKDRVSKEETVYVNLDASGAQTGVTVSDWLKNSAGAGALDDVSSLKDIQNVKGEETFSQDGDKLTWNTSDKDIYYQGTTDEQLPVGMTITYKLDGKEMTPQELLGKSGKLEMVIKYTNTQKDTVEVAGKDEELYVPFLMISGAILPVDHFTNVEVDHGNVMSEGDNNIIVGYGLPGMKESLDLDSYELDDDVDFDLDDLKDKVSDTVTVTADVKDFEMGAVYTVASNQFFGEMDLDDVDDLSDFTDQLDDLEDASAKLVDGSSDLADGTQTLADSFGDYQDGVDTLKNGAKTLGSGAATLNKGVKTYSKGADKLLKGVNSYVSGADSLATGIQSYTAGVSTLVAGVSQLNDSTKSLPDNYATFSQGLGNYITGVNTLLSEDNMTQLGNGVSALQSGVKTINAYASKLQKTEQLDQCVQGLTAMVQQYTQAAQQYTEAGDAANAATYTQMAAACQGAIDYIQGGEQVADGIVAATNGQSDGAADNNGQADLAAGLSTLSDSAKTMSGAAKQLRDASPSLTAGDATLKKGMSDIADAVSKIKTGGDTLVANNETINQGAKALNDNSSVIQKGSKKLTKSSPSLRKGAASLATGANSLTSGAGKLSTATNKVMNGIDKLNDGAGKLSDGMDKFDRKGIKKLTNKLSSVFDNASDFVDRLKGLKSAANGYSTLSGSDNNMDSTVKFIFTTEEISSDDN